MIIIIKKKEVILLYLINKNVKYFGGESGLIKRIKRDNRKKELCEQNGIKIVYIDWNEKDIEEKIIKNLL